MNEFCDTSTLNISLYVELHAESKTIQLLFSISLKENQFRGSNSRPGLNFNYQDLKLHKSMELIITCQGFKTVVRQFLKHEGLATEHSKEQTNDKL